MTHLANPIEMAVIGAAHGTTGEVRVKAHSENPLDLDQYGPLYDMDGNSYRITSLRAAKNVVIVRFSHIKTRDDAEKLHSRKLYIDRSQLPSIDEEDTFYHSDLIGLEVRDQQGQKIGKIKTLHDFGAGEIVEIRLPNGKEIMIPFTRAAMPEISLAEGFVIVDTNAAGLEANEEQKGSKDQ